MYLHSERVPTDTLALLIEKAGKTAEKSPLTQLESRQDGFGIEVEQAIHLAAHAEATSVTDSMCESHAFGCAAAIGEDEIGHPAVAVGATRPAVPHPHGIQTGNGVHHRLSRPFVGYEIVNDFITPFGGKKEVLGLDKRCVEIERHIGYVQVLLHVRHHIGYIVHIQPVDDHIDGHGTACSCYVFFQTTESSLAAYGIVHGSHSVQ